MSMTALDKWYGYMKSHDHAALWDLLHPDAVFESPVVHTPQRGRDITFKYLSSAAPASDIPGNGAAMTVRSSNSKTTSRASESTVSISSPSARMAGSRI